MQGHDNPWFEEGCFTRAKEGDIEAAREALQICIAGVLTRTLSPLATSYLVECLETAATAKGEVEIAQALHLKSHQRGRPKREDESVFALGLVAALLHKSGLKPTAIVQRMCELHDHENTVGDSVLDERIAWQIYGDHEPLRNWDEPLLQECLKRTGKYLAIFHQ